MRSIVVAAWCLYLIGMLLLLTSQRLNAEAHFLRNEQKEQGGTEVNLAAAPSPAERGTAAVAGGRSCFYSGFGCAESPFSDSIEAPLKAGAARGDGLRIKRFGDFL